MTFAAAVRGFARAPMRRRLLALEALAELCRARVVTLLPTRVLTQDLRRPGAARGPSDPPTPKQESDARRIGEVVAAVAAHMPFRAVCLQQAIAVSRMLARRGVPATICLGVNRDAGARRDPAQESVAHAWVEVGGQAVSGTAELERYTMIARFG